MILYDNHLLRDRGASNITMYGCSKRIKIDNFPMIPKPFGLKWQICMMAKLSNAPTNISFSQLSSY